MNPKIFKPGKDLSDFIMCYWTLEGTKDQTPRKNTIIPDGTMKLIFHYGDLYRHHPPNSDSFLLPRCFLISQLTHPYIVEPTGETGTFIVRFHPNGFLPFATIPVNEMKNTAIPLDKLFGEEGRDIEQTILNVKSTRERIDCIELFLTNQLKKEEVIDQIVQSTIETIVTANGQLSVNQISEQCNINRRILTRKFSSTVGLSPKQLSKIIRIQASLKTLLNKEVPKLTDLAYENEYFDQAHFIKDFKAFTGLTPKEFYGDDLKMSLIFDHEEE